LRIFVAVELPGSIKEKLSEIEQRLQGTGNKVRWVKVSSLHLTLKFLGEIKEEQVEEVFAVSQKVAKELSPFVIELTGVGAFPNPSSPRVIWVGVKKGQERLEDLALHLDEGLSEAGFPAEKRKWIPHLTLGRVKELREVEKLRQLILQEKETYVGEIEVKQFSVIKSRLTPTGPLYTILRSFPGVASNVL